jgi:sphinganine C4-monooxygenase
MAAANVSYELPPLPDYTLKPLPPLVPWASDVVLQAAFPVIGYWAVSLIYHLIDVYDLLPQYRLHTPTEVLQRNHVTRFEVFRDVIIQQVIQVAVNLALSLMDAPATQGKADYDVAWYAQKVRLAQRAIPAVLATVGVNPGAWASKVSASQPMLAGALSGGRYSGLVQTIKIAGQPIVAPAFASWELTLASIIYWYAVPALQFTAGICVIDAWEYALHRAMHMNKWLYGQSTTTAMSKPDRIQSLFTPVTTVYTCPTPMVHFTTIRSRVSLWIPWAPALRIWSQA